MPEATVNGNGPAALEAAASTTMIDPHAIGDRAAQAISHCMNAAADIDAMVRQVETAAEEIKNIGQKLSDDFRRRADALGKIVEGFAKLSEASARRMQEEREHLESLAKK